VGGDSNARKKVLPCSITKIPLGASHEAQNYLILDIVRYVCSADMNYFPNSTTFVAFKKV
jgi:hypothetical protein